MEAKRAGGAPDGAPAVEDVGIVEGLDVAGASKVVDAVDAPAASGEAAKGRDGSCFAASGFAASGVAASALRLSATEAADYVETTESSMTSVSVTPNDRATIHAETAVPDAVEMRAGMSRSGALAAESSGSSAGEPRLLDQMRDTIRVLHYSIRTEQTYLDWVRRYIRFHRLRHPRELDSPGPHRDANAAPGAGHRCEP